MKNPRKPEILFGYNKKVFHALVEIVVQSCKSQRATKIPKQKNNKFTETGYKPAEPVGRYHRNLNNVENGKP